MNNDKPSVYTVLFWIIQDKLIEPKILFDFLEFFWPTFIKKHGYVFLKEAFSKEEYERLMNENSDPEFWINLLTIDEFFSGLPDWEEKSISFAKALVSIWETKLKRDFPEMNFTVRYLHNEEDGDYGLTFYQPSKQDCKTNSSTTEISHPNIKENKLEQSSNGPRPGIPKIRRARTHEIP